MPPKSDIKIRSNRHLNQSMGTGHGMLQRDTVYSTLLSKDQKVSEVEPTFCTTYGCGATGLQSCPIFEFWPISPIQNL